MRFIVFAAVGLCACTPGDGTLTGAVREWTDPGAAREAREAADDSKCRRYGFKPRTEGYGNCRLQIDQIRATKNASVSRRDEGSAKLSMLCTEALSRGDNGAAQVHC
jgi:hypothetical protein